MSGTFEDIDVPPTLVSFAVDVATEKDIITPELKKQQEINSYGCRFRQMNTTYRNMTKVMDAYGKFTDDMQKRQDRICLRIRQTRNRIRSQQDGIR